MENKQLMKETTFCLAPWIHLVVTQGGEIRPCNDFQINLGNIKKGSLEAEFNNEKFGSLRNDILSGRTHPGCQGCRAKERLLGYSRRISMMNQAHEWGIISKKIKFSTKASTKSIVWLDIRFSNLCNMKCRHCYPALSTRWLEDIPHFKNVRFTKDAKLVSLENYFHAYRKKKKESLQLNKIIEIIDSVGWPLKRVEFKGGEPFLHKELPAFLKHYLEKIDSRKNIEKKAADKTRFIFVTNGSIVSPVVKDLIAKLDFADICFSIEGTGKVYDYIRGEGIFHLQDIRKNILELDALPNVKTSFRISCLAYNIFEIPKIYSWISKLPLKSNAKEIIIENYVVRPDFLNIMVLPYKIRHQAAKSISDILKSGKKNIHASIFNFYRSLDDRNDDFSKINLSNFQVFTFALDKIRGTDVKKSIPELAKFF